MKQTFPVLAALFAALVIAVVLIGNQSKPPRKAGPKAKAAVQKEMDPVFKDGFTVGFMMARTGAKKPSAADVDAMARQSAFRAGSKGELGYKMQWKNGFWMGWNQGD